MADSFNLTLLFLSLLLISFTFAKTTFRPKALLYPAVKDASTLQYSTHINHGTPQVSIYLTIDLGGQLLWADCDQDYVSSTYRPARCGSRPCSFAQSIGCGQCYSAPRPGCNNNTCGLSLENTITRTATIGDLGSLTISPRSTYATNPGPVVSLSKFLIVCGSTSLLKGLATDVIGMAGLGRTRISLPSQFAAGFSFARKFSICLSEVDDTGFLFFGNGPYIFLPNINVSSLLIYTPLISTELAEASADYFIGVKSIKINKTVVPIKGVTKISTIHPYTVLERSIYNDVVKAFVKEMGNVRRVGAVAPFGVCFRSKNIGKTRVGPSVPDIDLVLHSESVYWRIFGANSMVEVSNNVLCLGFVDGGDKATSSIVIGGYQMEDNLLEFDLDASRLGFSSSLLFRQTTCSNFNLTVIE